MEGDRKMIVYLRDYDGLKRIDDVVRIENDTFSLFITADTKITVDHNSTRYLITDYPIDCLEAELGGNA